MRSQLIRNYLFQSILLQSNSGRIGFTTFIFLVLTICCRTGVPKNNEDYSLLSEKVENNYRFVAGGFLNITCKEGYKDQGFFLICKTLHLSIQEVSPSFKILAKYESDIVRNSLDRL